MSNNNLVSIIMPAYYAEEYIEQSVRSVIGQTYENWELFIIDDCSRDSTLEIIKGLASEDSRLKVISLKNNVGPALARNEGLKLAHGRYIAFLDSDDFWLPKKLQCSLEAMKEQSADLVYTAYRRVNAQGTEEGRLIKVPSTMTYKKLLSNTVITTSTVVYDTKRIGKVMMKNVYYDDFSCWLELLKRGAKSYGLNDDLTRYRISGAESVSGNKLKSAQKVWKQLRTHEKLNFFSTLKVFISYSVRGYLKHRKF